MHKLLLEEVRRTFAWRRIRRMHGYFGEEQARSNMFTDSLAYVLDMLLLTDCSSRGSGTKEQTPQNDGGLTIEKFHLIAGVKARKLLELCHTCTMLHA